MVKQRQSQSKQVAQNAKVSLPHGRKLAKSAEVDQRPTEERFFQAVKRDAAWCCYGLESTLRALELYAVDELLVAEDLESSDVVAWHSRWETLAAEHKVARLHYISASTPQGRNFCRSVCVAGLLGHRIDFMDDLSPISPIRIEKQSNNRFLATEAAEVLPIGEPKLARAVSNLPHRGSDPHSAYDAFFTWLQRALRSELSEDEMSALALFDCVHVIMSGAPNEEDDTGSMKEALEDAVGVLILDAPTCAEELQFRWWAAHLAESDFELSAVAEVSSKLSELPAHRSFVAASHPSRL